MEAVHRLTDPQTALGFGETLGCSEFRGIEIVKVRLQAGWSRWVFQKWTQRGRELDRQTSKPLTLTP